jgi:hypothetical protein
VTVEVMPPSVLIDLRSLDGNRHKKAPDDAGALSVLEIES